MIYHCDAILPTDQRYTSHKFRMYSRWFRPTKFSFEEAAELIAFVEVVGLKHAQTIFHWSGQAPVKAYAKLLRHMQPEVQVWIDANLASLGVDDGVAVLRALKDGGWERGSLPLLVKWSVREEPSKFTKLLTYSQIAWIRRPTVVSRRIAAQSALGVAS